MQTPTSPHAVRRRWAHAAGGGLTALVVLAVVAIPAGAAATSPRPSGASGSVAALSGSSMEVQNAGTGQTTVGWTATTQFSKTVTEAVSALTVGECVSVTGTASKKSKTTIAARSITVTTPSASGTCDAFGRRAVGGAGGAAPGAGGFPFRRGGASGSTEGGGSATRPSFPGGGSSPNTFRKQLGNLSIASGKVTAVSGSTVSISGTSFSLGSLPKSGAKNTKPTKPTTPKTEKVTATTSGSTTVSSTQSAASTDLAVGDCVSAFGPAATNGSVTATTIRITSTGGATCTATGGFGGTRFGGGFGGGPGGPAGAGGPGGSGA